MFIRISQDTVLLEIFDATLFCCFAHSDHSEMFAEA